MQKASEVFPLADREGAIDIIGLFMFGSAIAFCFKCLEKSILFCSWSEEDVGRNILHFLRQVSYYSSQRAETIWVSHRFKARKKLENLLIIQMERYPQETTASATYMVVELLDHFWCHQSHFHPYPHTNSIHCQHGTEWAGNSHAHHTGEWSDQLFHPSGRKNLHCQELLHVRAGIWSFLPLGEKNNRIKQTPVNISVLANNCSPLTINICWPPIHKNSYL